MFHNLRSFGLCAIRNPVLPSTNPDRLLHGGFAASTDAWKSSHGHSRMRSSLSSAVAPAAKYEIHRNLFSTEARLLAIPAFPDPDCHICDSTFSRQNPFAENVCLPRRNANLDHIGPDTLTLLFSRLLRPHKLDKPGLQWTTCSIRLGGLSGSVA